MLTLFPLDLFPLVKPLGISESDSIDLTRHNPNETLAASVEKLIAYVLATLPLARGAAAE
jgi:hypothetical protein